ASQIAEIGNILQPTAPFSPQQQLQSLQVLYAASLTLAYCAAINALAMTSQNNNPYSFVSIFTILTSTIAHMILSINTTINAIRTNCSAAGLLLEQHKYYSASHQSIEFNARFIIQ